MAIQSGQQETNLNWASDLLSVMQQAGTAFNSPDIMLGEVVTAPPNLTIKVGNVILYKEQLLVADYLLSGCKRAYYQDGVMYFKAQADAELNGDTKETETPAASVPAASVPTHGFHDHGTHTHPPHKHDLNSIEVTTTKENFFAHGDGKDPVLTSDKFNGTAAKDKYFYFTDTLKPKDLLLVQQVPNMHYFVVKCCLIKMEDVTADNQLFK